MSAEAAKKATPRAATAARGFFRPGKSVTAIRSIPLATGLMIPAGAVLGAKFVAQHRLKRWWQNGAIGLTNSAWTRYRLSLVKAEEDNGKWVKDQARKAAEALKAAGIAAEDDLIGQAVQAANDAEQAAVALTLKAEAAQELADQLAVQVSDMLEAAAIEELPEGDPGLTPAKEAAPDPAPPETPAPAAKKKPNKKGAK